MEGSNNKTLDDYLELYRQKHNFQSKEWIDRKVEKLNGYMTKHNLSGCVIGLSGGIDSAVTFALAVKAMKTESSPIKLVVPVLMPMNLDRPTYSLAVEMCESVNIKPFVNTIGHMSNIIKESMGVEFSDWFEAETDNVTDWKPSLFAYGQLQSYLRTPHLYFATQLLSDRGYNSIVLGTGNADEDHYLGYFCKAGDGVVDLQLVNDLHKSQVFTIGKELNVVESILKAKPTADLWDGQSDEEELGVSYDFVELFTGYYLKLSNDDATKFYESLTPVDKQNFDKWSEICQKVHQRNNHKLNGVINL